MKSTELAQEHWNATPLYLSEEKRYSIYPWLYEVAEFREHAGEQVLEIGCGTGSDLLQFAKHGAIATGVDVTPAHLELARQRVGGMARVVEASATKLPFDDATFDYVYSHGVIHHIEQPKAAANEIMRVLKPGGRFNIHLYAKFSYFPLLRMILNGTAWKDHIENSTVPVHIDLYTKRSVQRLFPVPVTVSKVFFPYMPFLQKLLGWYLIVKGTKPLS